MSFRRNSSKKIAIGVTMGSNWTRVYLQLLCDALAKNLVEAYGRKLQMKDPILIVLQKYIVS